MNSGICFSNRSDGQIWLVTTAFGLLFISESYMCMRFKSQAESSSVRRKRKLTSVMSYTSVGEKKKNNVIRK